MKLRTILGTATGLGALAVAAQAGLFEAPISDNKACDVTDPNSPVVWVPDGDYVLEQHDSVGYEAGDQFCYHDDGATVSRIPVSEM